MTRSGHVTTTLLVLSGISGAALDATLLPPLIETCPADILLCVTGPMLHRVIVWYVALKLEIVVSVLYDVWMQQCRHRQVLLRAS